MREVVVRHDLRGAPPERLAVLPEPDLGARRPRADPYERHGGGCAGEAGNAQRGQHVGGAPGQGDQEADQREVREPIGHRLAADLHQADHRQQRDQVPEPADHQVRPPPARRDRDTRHGNEYHGGQQGRPLRDRPEGIEGREPGRPEHHLDVAHRRDRSIREALDDGHCFKPLHPADLQCGGEGHRAAGQGQHEQRHLLHRQPREGAARSRRVLEAGPHRRTRAEPVERPDVEQQQHQRQRHQRRLRHQAEREAGDHRRVADAAGDPHVPEVRPEREHPEPAAQDVLALGHPRYRFDVQRVNGEQRGDHRAPPGMARHSAQDCEQEQRGQQVEGRGW